MSQNMMSKFIRLQNIAKYSKVIYTMFGSVSIIEIAKEAPMERLLTTEEVGELLRIDPVTVRKLVTRGELIAYRIAGEYRFTATNVEKFVESQQVMVNASPKDQFAKFTERARKVLSLANEEAQQYHHEGVGTEHVLLGIMDEGGGVAAKVLLELLQVEASEVRKQIEELHPARDYAGGDGLLGMTPQGKGSIELAVQEARLLDHHYIGTEHLLLGLLREEEGLASQVLRKSGVTLEDARNRVKKVLTTKSPNRIKQLFTSKSSQDTSEPKQDEES
jgi:excisionase family DNA binding protein